MCLWVGWVRKWAFFFVTLWAVERHHLIMHGNIYIQVHVSLLNPWHQSQPYNHPSTVLECILPWWKKKHIPQRPRTQAPQAPNLHPLPRPFPSPSPVASVVWAVSWWKQYARFGPKCATYGSADISRFSAVALAIEPSLQGDVLLHLWCAATVCSLSSSMTPSGHRLVLGLFLPSSLGGRSSNMGGGNWLARGSMPTMMAYVGDLFLLGGVVKKNHLSVGSWLSGSMGTERWEGQANAPPGEFVR